MSNFIEVTGNGAATQAPDRIDLHIAVSLVRPGVAEALDAVNSRVRDLGVALREAGLGDADIRTTHSNVSEEYGGPDNARSGYRAGQDLQLRVADLGRLDEVLAAAVAAAGDDFRMSHLAWAISDPAALMEQARAAAFEDARAKAEQLAALTGAELGALRRIVEGYGGGGVPRLAMAKADAAGFAPERGSSQVETSLTVRWALVHG
ncbi:DUF541 domain-containing protein [Nocardioides marmoriginsengisoli]|uniref:DUF541 domain-containing protein n=1 Tax=Nocardioides marmoriginsengisoli TaxID=661483 RepID=A0A3N0CMY2_9ACTN|nr:SIMPL domain-containing protein [Nocardioides marmoriginsengisoli]RNL64817.1 DUF541 domain-containing protein [Nocardioides marmoriginsengisoli]